MQQIKPVDAKFVLNGYSVILTLYPRRLTREEVKNWIRALDMEITKAI